jgi:hypothetical protein
MGFWGSLLLVVVGFVLGLFGPLWPMRVQRRQEKRGTDAYNRKVVFGLVGEIEAGIERAKYMEKLADENAALYARIYVALWQSTNQQLAATLDDAHVLTLLHRIYRGFDSVNFISEQGEYGRAGGFAHLSLPDIERDLAELKKVVEE